MFNSDFPDDKDGISLTLDNTVSIKPWVTSTINISFVTHSPAWYYFVKYIERSTWVHVSKLRSLHCAILCLSCMMSTLLSLSGPHGETWTLILRHNRMVRFLHTRTYKSNWVHFLLQDLLGTIFSFLHSYRIPRHVLFQCATRRGHQHRTCTSLFAWSSRRHSSKL